MKKDLYTIRLACFIFCFVLFIFLELGSGNGNLFAQGSLKPPTAIPAGKPQVMQIPKTAGGSYVIQTKGGARTIKLEPPKVFDLPVVKKFISNGIQNVMPDQAEAGHGLFTTFTTENGLALDAVACSFMDKMGNLWFGTIGGGVSRYDGKSFTNFTLAQGLINNIVRCITEDKTGNLWFGTDAGVSRYDGRSITNFTTLQGLINDRVTSITEDRTGSLWFGTDGGVSRYDRHPKDSFGRSSVCFTNFTTIQGLVSDTVFCIAEDKAGNLWFGTNGGVSRYDKHPKDGPIVDSFGKDSFGRSVARFTNFTTLQGLANNSVRSITEDRTGNLWFGTYGGGVSRYDGKSFTNFTTLQGLADNAVWCITEDKTGNLWFGTNGGGVSRYDGHPKDGPIVDSFGKDSFGRSVASFTNFTTLQGLANNKVRSITEDKAGNLWFCTHGGGVSRYDGKSFINFTTSHGLANNSVRSITEDKAGNLWFGTYGGGVSCYDGKSFTNFTTLQGLADNTVWSVMEDKTGNLWFGTEGGVSCYDAQTKDSFGRSVASFRNFTMAQGLPNNSVKSIIEDKTGNLWFGTLGGGVSRYDRYSKDSLGRSLPGRQAGAAHFTNFTTVQGLANNKVRSITEDKTGNLWIGTYGGVSRYDGRPKESLGRSETRFTNFTPAQGLANNVVFNIREDKAGNLWFATPQGLSYLEFGGAILSSADRIKENANDNRDESKGNANSLLFKTISSANGLPDDNVTQVLELPNGKMVVGTNSGVAIFNPSSHPGQKPDVPEIYNLSTGYPIKDVNAGPNAMFRDSKGIIWIATGSDKTGLVRFDYSEVTRNLNPPTVIIQSIKINEENICWYDLNSGFWNKDLGIKKEDEKKVKSLYRRSQQDSTIIVQQEVMTYGKMLSDEVRDSICKKFSGIRFYGITKFYPLPLHLVLPYEHNQIGFEYAAIETSRPNLVKYQYILEGYDRDWSPLTNKTNVSFGHIHEGTYIFKLKAQSPFGVWSQPVTYTFTVLPPWWRTWWVYSGYVVLGICFVIIVVWWNGRRLRARAKELAQEVRKATATIVEQKKVVEDQKKVVEEQKKSVEEKNKHITDSINYAQRIQNAILPNTDFVKNLVDDHFIFFQPKEIVSGDFYWFGRKNDKIIFAAVDCTGHGVPGAFMSMIGNTLLNEIINEKGIVDPDEILNHLRSDIIRALKQSDASDSQRDGMDIALCVLDRSKNRLSFSGAHNPLYLYRNGIFTEFKSDSQSIGYEKGVEEPYSKIEIEIQKGDTFYIFTDGFADQKGGERKRKYYYKTFQDLLASIQHEPMARQQEILMDTFNKWKGTMEQIDDVLVIGVRV